MVTKVVNLGNGRQLDCEFTLEGRVTNNCGAVSIANFFALIKESKPSTAFPHSEAAPGPPKMLRVKFNTNEEEVEETGKVVAANLQNIFGAYVQVSMVFMSATALDVKAQYDKFDRPIPLKAEDSKPQDKGVRSYCFSIIDLMELLYKENLGVITIAHPVCNNLYHARKVNLAAMWTPPWMTSWVADCKSRTNADQVKINASIDKYAGEKIDKMFGIQSEPLPEPIPEPAAKPAAAPDPYFRPAPKIAAVDRALYEKAVWDIMTAVNPADVMGAPLSVAELNKPKPKRVRKPMSKETRELLADKRRNKRAVYGIHDTVFALAP